MRPGLFVFLLLIASNVMAAKTPLIVGVWKHPEGGVVIARPDGTLHTSIWKGAEGKGRWSAADKKGYDYIFRWQTKTKNVDQIKVSRDGKSYAGFNNQFNTVIRWQMVRDSYPPPEKATKKKPAKPVKKQAKKKKLTKRELSKLKFPNGVYHAFQARHPWTHVYRVKDMVFEWPLSINENGTRWDEIAARGLVQGRGRFISPDRMQVIWQNLKDRTTSKQIWTITNEAVFIEDYAPGPQGRCLMIIDSNVGSKMPAIRAVNEQPPAAVQKQLEEPEEEPLQPFSLDDEPREEPLEPFSLDDDPVEEEADLPPPTDPEGILDRAGLYEGRRSVWYLNRANNFAARTYERLSKSSEIHSALRAVNGRLPTKTEMNNPPSRR